MRTDSAHQRSTLERLLGMRLEFLLVWEDTLAGELLDLISAS
jgi:hypothetical protein